MVRKLVIICALALASSTCFAQSEDSQASDKEGLYTLRSLYSLSPENPWHGYLLHDESIPLALRSLKEHLTTMDPTLEQCFEDEEINATLCRCFAAYFKAQGHAAWDKVIDHLEATFNDSTIFATEADSENAVKDVVLALENYIVDAHVGENTDLMEAVLKQIPWFFEGVPAYISDILNPQEEMEEEDIVITEEACTETAPEQSLALSPLALETKKDDAKTRREQCKESLRKAWDEDIKPFLKRTRTKFDNFIQKVKDSTEFQKVKQEFDKAERELRAFRKDAVNEVKNFFKKKKW